MGMTMKKTFATATIESDGDGSATATITATTRKLWKMAMMATTMIATGLTITPRNMATMMTMKKTSATATIESDGDGSVTVTKAKLQSISLIRRPATTTMGTTLRTTTTPTATITATTRKLWKMATSTTRPPQRMSKLHPTRKKTRTTAIRMNQARHQQFKKWHQQQQRNLQALIGIAGTTPTLAPTPTTGPATRPRTPTAPTPPPTPTPHLQITLGDRLWITTPAVPTVIPSTHYTGE